MKVLVTGTSGFLGKYVVAEALRRGHQVRAMVRPTSDAKRLPWHNHPAVELVYIDLRRRDGIVDVVKSVDAVIHLAAAKEGDYDTQFASTVVATENLLKAMIEANVLRLVAISTFSVFDYLYIGSGETISESSPIERDPTQRDTYAQTKLIQEKVIRDFEQNYGGQVTILRPGMIYGREHLWNACLGVKVSNKLWIRIGAHAQIPLTYIENCAEAIVISAQRDQAIGETLNIVDDDLPTQSTYAKKLVRRLTPPPRTILLHWTVMHFLSRTIWLCNKLLFKSRVKLPGIFVPARLHARFKPLHYSNIHAKQILNWNPKYSLDSALERSCSDVELLALSHQTSRTSSI